MWKGGSGRQFTTSLPLDPLDPVDPLACSKLVFRVRETLLFVLKTHRSLYCVFKRYNVAILGAEKAPAGMLTRKTDSLERKGAILCLSLIHI